MHWCFQGFHRRFKGTGSFRVFQGVSGKDVLTHLAIDWLICHNILGLLEGFALGILKPFHRNFAGFRSVLEGFGKIPQNAHLTLWTPWQSMKPSKTSKSPLKHLWKLPKTLPADETPLNPPCDTMGSSRMYWNPFDPLKLTNTAL